MQGLSTRAIRESTCRTNRTVIEDPEVFVVRFNNRWGFKTNVKAIQRENSGPFEFMNKDIEELESEIDLLLKDSGKFYEESEKNKEVLDLYSEVAYLAYKDEPLSNLTDYTQKEVKDIFFGIIVNANSIYKLKITVG